MMYRGLTRERTSLLGSWGTMGMTQCQHRSGLLTDGIASIEPSIHRTAPELQLLAHLGVGARDPDG